MSLMGIDIGTTSSKAMVFSLEGDLLTAHSEQYPLITNEHRHCVLNPREVWSAVKACIHSCSTETARRDPVSALAVSSQGEAVIPLDRRGAVLAHAPISADARGEEFLSEAAANPGAEYLFRTTGQIIDPIHTLFKILWWKKYTPELYRRTWKFLTFDGFALMKMGLPPIMEPTMAARTMCFDIPRGCWSETIHRSFGLDKNKMPELIERGRPAGTIEASIARELGFTARVSAVPGGHDQPCGALGAGIHHSGVVYSIGTTECLTFVTQAPRNESPRKSPPAALPGPPAHLHSSLPAAPLASPVPPRPSAPAAPTGSPYPRTSAPAAPPGPPVPPRPSAPPQPSLEPPPRFPVYPHVLEGHQVTLAGSLTGGALFSWLRDKVIRHPDPDFLFNVEKQMNNRHTTEVIFLAHLAGSGLHYANPESRGIIHGLNLNTGLEDILKAAQEGITFEQYLCFTALEEHLGEPGDIVAAGGGTNSPNWMQVKADIFQRPIRTPALPDASVLGAALLAGLGSGAFTAPRAAIDAMTGSGKTYYPQTDMAAYYSEKLERYNTLYTKNNEEAGGLTA